MNKDLEAATGDYVWFMNDGDQIADEKTLECVMRNKSPLHDVYTARRS